MPASFTDLAGREWLLKITHGARERVLVECKIDLYALADSKVSAYQELTSEPGKLVAVIFCLIEAEADKREVTPEAFAESIDGDVLEAVATALWEAFVFFSPKSSREALGKILPKAKRVQEILSQRMVEAINEMNPEKMVDRMMNGPPKSSVESSTS